MDEQLDTPEAELRSELSRLRQALADLARQLESAQEDKERLEGLLRRHPDTDLPVLRVFRHDLEEALEAGDAGWVAQIRLDSIYARIKPHRDRNKVLLYISTLRMQKVLGPCLYQSDRLDEFFVLCRDAVSEAEIIKSLARMLHEVELPHEGPAGDISFGAYVAFQLLEPFDRDGCGNECAEKAMELLTNLDIALMAGIQKRKRIVPYRDALGNRYRRLLALEQELRTAIQKGFDGLKLAFQPFVDHSETICGSESLIRWNHAELGYIVPPDFIPIAERNGDIRILGRWILYQSILQLKKWRDAGYDHLYVSVNLSPVQFMQKDLVQSIVEVLDANGVDGSHLKLEVTEGALMADPKDAIEKLNALRDHGIRISIDDFGTGYSSLNYLRKLPIDTLKIDKSFVDDITKNQQNRQIVRAILSMAHSLEIETLAEGVEDKDQRDLLVSEGCKLIQGYYYSRPVDHQVFTSYLEAGGRLPVP